MGTLRDSVKQLLHQAAAPAFQRHRLLLYQHFMYVNNSVSKEICWQNGRVDSIFCSKTVELI